MGVLGFSSGPMGADRTIHSRLVLSNDCVGPATEMPEAGRRRLHWKPGVRSWCHCQIKPWEGRLQSAGRF